MTPERLSEIKEIGAYLNPIENEYLIAELVAALEPFINYQKARTPPPPDPSYKPNVIVIGSRK